MTILIRKNPRYSCVPIISLFLSLHRIALKTLYGLLVLLFIYRKLAANIFKAPHSDSIVALIKTMKLCELCHQRAFVYCSSDSAFLCWDCDAKVHAANFLVARHAREALCLVCEGLAGEFISGSGLSETRRGLCGSCSPENFPGDGDDVVDDDDDSLSSFSSSSTNKKEMRKIESISSSLTNLSERFSGERVAARSTKRRVVRLRAPASNLDAKAEGIFVIWSRKFGVDGNVVSSACHALMFCLGKMTVLPFRVALAASFWFSLRLCGNRTASTWQQQVRRLEDISGVPAKQILAVESKLARVLRVSREPQDLKEGWAECNA